MASDPPPSAVPVERARSERPGDPAWRADALARSRHSRLLDELVAPAGDPDPRRARSLCAELCRTALRDFAPALALLPAAERERCQALAGYALTLFDFARQRGPEGERLAQINRWEFELERCLGGEEARQPVFVAMAAAHRRRPWPDDGLAELVNAARARVLHDRPASARQAASRFAALGAAVTVALLGERSDATADFAAGLLRLRSLLDLGEELAGGRCPLPRSEVPDAWDPAGGPTAEALGASIERSAGAARVGILRLGRALPGIPRRYRRPAVYLLHAGQRLLLDVEARGREVVERPPRLGLAERIALLLRARWGTWRV